MRGLRALPYVLEQRRLADTGIAADHERSAARPEAIDHRVEAPQLIVAPDQSGRLKSEVVPLARRICRTPYWALAASFSSIPPRGTPAQAGQPS